MFGLKKDPIKKLERQYARKMAEATKAQRAGKIPELATLSAEAEELGRQLDRARKKAG